MAKAVLPELRKYMDKRLVLQLNGNRKLSGVLRGFDPFMNLVLEETIDETNYGGTEKSSNKASLGMIVVRGNSVQMVEALERIH